MKFNHLLSLSLFGLSSIIFKRKKPILATIILTDKCNLSCRHCAVNNVTCIIYSYEMIKNQMIDLYSEGIRILFFCGGETFMWEDSGKTLRDLVEEAKKIGFYIVNVVTNGTFPLDLPEASLILLSLDGGKEKHNNIRGETYDLIIENIRNSSSKNICLYMAVNNTNHTDIEEVCKTARDETNISAVSFNFHTPYEGTEQLCLSHSQKADCLHRIASLSDKGYPVFNLKSAFPYHLDNSFSRPCRQCLVLEGDKRFVCGRCIDIPDLCNQCGYLFAAEYALAFGGKIRVIADMLKTYTKFI